jgi:hypothetical protein
MQVFNLENERELPTAIEAHLCEGSQDAGFARLRAKHRERVRPLLKTQEMQEHRRPRLWRHVYFLETTVDFCGDVLGSVSIRNATVVPQQVEHREVRCRTPIGETASGAIRQPSPPQTTAELIDQP